MEVSTDSHGQWQCHGSFLLVAEDMEVKFDDICDRVITTKLNSRPATAPTESVPVTMDNANISDMSVISYDNVDYLNCDLPTSQAAFLMQ